MPDEGVSDLPEPQRFDATIRIAADGRTGVVEYLERNSPTVWSCPAALRSELLDRDLDGRSMMRTLDVWAFSWLEKPEHFDERLCDSDARTQGNHRQTLSTVGETTLLVHYLGK